MGNSQAGGTKGGTKWGPLLGSSVEVNELAGQLREWLDEAGLTLNQVAAAFTEDHFGGRRPPGRTATGDRLAGKHLDLMFAEAVVDVCSERHADAAPRLLIVRRMWERVRRPEPAAPTLVSEPAGLQALVDSQRETIEVHRQLARALEALAHSEQVRADSEKLVIVLVQMINQLTSRIRSLRRGESLHLKEPETVRRLAEVETLLSQALLEKQAAETQWQEALALADAAQRQVLILQRELRQARGERVEQAAPTADRSMPRLAEDPEDTDPEFLADIEQALTTAHSVNQDNQALTEQAREDLARLAEDDGHRGSRPDPREGGFGDPPPKPQEQAPRRAGAAGGESDAAVNPGTGRPRTELRLRATLATFLAAFVMSMSAFLLTKSGRQSPWSLLMVSATALALAVTSGVIVVVWLYFPDRRRAPIADTETPADRASALLSSQRQLIADASYELRTPLTALSIRLEEIIALADDPSVVRVEAEVALSQVERLADVVQRQLTPGPAGISVAVDVDSAIRQQIHEWRPVYQASRRGIVVSGVRRTTAMTAPGVISQIMSILLENALAHGEGIVTIRTRSIRDAVVIEVEDEGPGVTDEQADGLFHRSPGQARGLPIARELAQSHGGRLDLVRDRPAVLALFLPRDTTIGQL